MASTLEILNAAQLGLLLNRPTAMLLQTTTFTAATSANTQVPFQSAVGDVWGGWSSGAATQYTVQVAGTYRLDGMVVWPGNSTGNRSVQLYHNGSLVNGTVATWAAPPGASQFPQSAGPVQVAAAAGDTFQLNVYQSSGSALTMQATGCLNVEFLRF